MNFPSPLINGTLIKRYRRSLADVRLEGDRVVTVHVFSLGSMKGCSEPGRPVLISDSGDRTRRHPLTLEMIDVNGVWVGANPTLSRHVVHEALQRGEIETLRGYRIEGEAIFGRGRRVDIVLQNMEENCFINVHSITWVEHGNALFPDTPGNSARRSLEELSGVAGQGHRAIALFHVLRGDCERARSAKQGDPDCLKALSDAKRAGVGMLAYRAGVSPSGISLGEPIPFSVD